MPTRAFHLGTILTVTTHRMVAPGGFADVHEFLEYMAGEPVWTHQLPRVMDEAQPIILTQHPQLVDAVIPDDFGTDPEAAASVWLAGQVERFGETLEVAPLDPQDHTSIDPLDEFGLMGVGPDRVVPVVVDPDPRRS